jgi:hypothetical protein
MTDNGNFLKGSMVFAAAISAACGSLEQQYSGDKELPIPGGYDKDDVGIMVCAGLLLTTLGVIADESAGRDRMMDAVERMGDRKFPLGQDIRIALNRIMDVLGMKDERHRWN